MLRNRNQGYMAVRLMLVSTQFLHFGTDQYGDNPLSLFILGSLALFTLKDRRWTWTIGHGQKICGIPYRFTVSDALQISVGIRDYPLRT